MKYVAALVVSIAFSIAAAITPASVVVIRLSEKLPVLLAVLLAAVFVRLARGMPPIPYDKVAESNARIATKAFRSLISAYVQTFAIFIIAIILNLGVSLLTPVELASFPQYIIPALLALFDGLVVASIILLVESDVRLAGIQADMMDEVTSSSSAKAANQTAAVVRDAFKPSDREIPRISTP